MKRLEFTFEGTRSQFDFFEHTVSKELPNAHLELDDVSNGANGYEFDCSMISDHETAFEIGMIVAATYGKFGHLEGTMFDN